MRTNGSDCEETPAAVDSVLETTKPRRDRVELEVGEIEKHVVEITFSFPPVMKVDGEDVSGQVRCSVAGNIEVFEASVGTGEISEVRFEREPGILLPSKIRVFVRGRLVKVLHGRRRKATHREMIYRVALPAVFLCLVAYYAMIENPDVMKFYSAAFRKAPKRQVQPNKARASLAFQHQKPESPWSLPSGTYLDATRRS